jgi:hypothetical protein
VRRGVCGEEARYSNALSDLRTVLVRLSQDRVHDEIVATRDQVFAKYHPPSPRACPSYKEVHILSYFENNHHRRPSPARVYAAADRRGCASLAILDENRPIREVPVALGLVDSRYKPVY